MKLITKEEVGECRLAIRAVELEGKPIVEVCCRPGDRAELFADLETCLRDAAATGVRPWIRPVIGAPTMTCYGFYGEPWVLDAFDWWREADLEPVDRHWIGGLLFGYTPAAIQAFIDKE